MFPDDVFYVQVKPEDVEEIVDVHIVGNQRVKRLLYEAGSSNQGRARSMRCRSIASSSASPCATAV